MALLSLAAACTPIEDLPLLPTDPTEAEVAKHVVRYCGRLDTCAAGEDLGMECRQKMLEGARTPEGRRGLAAMMNLFGPCMTMDCISMTACFTAQSIQVAKEQMDKSPPPRRTPRTP